MKQLLHIFIGVILFGLSACQRETTYPIAMQQAESLMNTRPDSALHMLQGMADSVSTFPEETQMYYHLLSIQAKDKQYITHTSDSLINHIVEFYDDYGNNDRLMMAYFYQGSTYRDMNDAPQALKSFQQVVDLHVPNHELLAKTYNQMGKLFMYQNLHDEVIRVNQKSIELYLTEEKQGKISYAQRDIARMYDVKNMPDSALFYYNSACKTAITDNDSVRYYGILGELGGYYCQIGNIDSAKQLLKLVEKKSYIQDKANIYIMLGHVYRELGLLDSAYYYYNKNLPNSNIRNEYYNLRELFNIEKEQKNYEQAIHHIDKALTLKDSIDIISQTEAIAKINALYNYQHIETKNNQLKQIKEKQEKQILILLLILLICTLCYIIFYFVQKEKKQKEIETEKRLKEIAEIKYATSIEVIRYNEEKIKALSTELQKALQEKDTHKAEQLQIQQRKLQSHNEEIVLLRKEQELRIVAFQRSSIYQEFKQAAINEHINLCSTKFKYKWEELESAINETYPHFIERLTLLCPKLSVVEKQVCLLTKAEISPIGIATILKYSRQGITNIRTRIHKRIQKTDKEYATFDVFIESF